MTILQRKSHPVKADWWKGHITGIRDRAGTQICEGNILDSEWPKGQFVIVWEPRDAGFQAYKSVDMLHKDTTIGLGTGQWSDAIIIK